jgi:K(+)-stimulated pyrophosphate-energized sodium pump
MKINPGVIISTIAGLIIAVVIGFTTDYFTSDENRPVQEVARVSGSGSAINIITGFSYGLISVLPSLIGIVVATLVSYYVTEYFGIPGIYGIGISAVGMLSVTGMIVASDAYGPIVDNAKGIAEMSGMPHEVVDRADVLDSAGNTAKAITKGFAIGAAALTVLALFSAYSEVIEARGSALIIDLRNPLILCGVFLGAAMPPLFSALTMLAVTKNAFAMIEEIRRQFKAFPGILAGTQTPDYATCVGLAAKGALTSLVIPAFIAVVVPLLVGFVLGRTPRGSSAERSYGVILPSSSRTGGIVGQCKKYIESGNFGGPGSDSPKALSSRYGRRIPLRYAVPRSYSSRS